MPRPARITGRLAVLSSSTARSNSSCLWLLRMRLTRQVRSARLPIEFGGSLLRVLGEVHEHRAGTPGLGDDENFAERARDIFRPGDHHVVFGDRHGDAGDVHFLKGIGAEHLAADLPGDADHRGRIQHGRGNAGDHVGGARAGSGHGDADAARGARIAIGHVRGALFVAHENVMQLGFAKRIVDRKNRAAGIAEDVTHAEARQCFTKDFRTSHFHRVLPEDPGREPDEKESGREVTAPSEAEETR